MSKTNIKNVRILRIPTSSLKGRGGLVFGEAGKDIPFPIQRFYVINHVPRGNVKRGMHAHKKLKQVFVCLQGSVTLRLDDGSRSQKIVLKNSGKGVFVGPGIWRALEDFSQGSVVLVLASQHYDEADYIRDYRTFLSRYGTRRNKKP